MRRCALAWVVAGSLLAGCTPRKFAGLLPLPPAAPGFVSDSATPELRWQPLPEGARITDVVYDLKVYDPHQMVVVEREGLKEARFRLEQDLIPGLTYEWTVRARYRIDGARRRTEWTEREDTYIRDGYIVDRPRKYVPLTVLPAP